jgi:site-specific DNA-methyltransferase (adenine-specific)
VYSQFLSHSDNILIQKDTSWITIDQAAQTAKVSVATIRNWLKSGYIKKSNQGLIFKKSMDTFMSEIAGTEKLKSRANKSLKDSYNHQYLSDQLGTIFRTYSDEHLGIEYENALSNSFRNLEGVYYTPSNIVKDMFNGIKIEVTHTFLDPCCGSGNFLIEAIRQGILPENVYGYDIDENAVAIARERIFREFGYQSNNILVADFLSIAKTLERNFDLIFTNPPWGKKINNETKGVFSNFYNCGKSTDTTSLFLGASLVILKPNGKLGFLIQEAFFNISTFEDIRKRVIAKKILRFVDYGKPFKGLITKAQAVILENKKSDKDNQIECNTNNSSFYRSLNSFIDNPKTIFNFWINESEATVIKKIFEVPHIKLKGRAKWAIGIVTGNNSRFCSQEYKKGYLPIYKGSDITKAGLKEPSTFIVNDFSNLQQVAPLSIYQAKEKLIYKFISSNLCFYWDTEQRLILNSANMLIPENLQIDSKQLTSLLNSEIMNWLFKKLFSTHKVLRGDIEMLPIHTDYFTRYNLFSEVEYLIFLGIKRTEDGNYCLRNLVS